MDSLRSRIEAEIPHLRRYARALVGGIEEADDLVQACLERALSRASQWDPTRGLRPWLFRILHNLYVSWLRGRDREFNFQRKYPEHDGFDADHESSIALDVVGAAMEKLPRDHRDAILLVAVEGLSYQEASSVLAVPVGTVRSRLSRARETLRELVETAPGEDDRRRGAE
ncbi:MAG: RNA polymerase sigma factor [Ectothiorhodospiraceae bacterium]|nr:RNA polymerase sigma factor [Ectothiorhodospiraceae bacterium]